MGIRLPIHRHHFIHQEVYTIVDITQPCFSSDLKYKSLEEGFWNKLHRQDGGLIVQRQWWLFGGYRARIPKHPSDEHKLWQSHAMRNHRRRQDTTRPSLWRGSLVATPESFYIRSCIQDDGEACRRLQIPSRPSNGLISKVYGIPHILVHDRQRRTSNHRNTTRTRYQRVAGEVSPAGLVRDDACTLRGHQH